jgi:hypothetical protein
VQGSLWEKSNAGNDGTSSCRRNALLSISIYSIEHSAIYLTGRRNNLEAMAQLMPMRELNCL